MNKRWVDKDNGGGSVLIFTPYYDDIEIGEVFYEEDGGWCYSSSFLDTTNEYLGSDSLEYAKEEVEYAIEVHCEDEINYYKDLLDKFKEGANDK